MNIKNILIIGLLFLAPVLHAQGEEKGTIDLLIKKIGEATVLLYQSPNNDQAALQTEKLAGLVQSLRTYEDQLDLTQATILTDAKLMLYTMYKTMSAHNLEEFKAKLVDYVRLVDERPKLINEKKDDMVWLINEAEKGFSLRCETHSNLWKSDVTMLAELVPYYIEAIENHTYVDQLEYKKMIEKVIYYQGLLLKRLETLTPEYLNLDIIRLINYTGRLQMFTELNQETKIGREYLPKITKNLSEMKGFLLK